MADVVRHLGTYGPLPLSLCLLSLYSPLLANIPCSRSGPMQAGGVSISQSVCLILRKVTPEHIHQEGNALKTCP